ncbi:hypothetical protein PENSTE_c002G00887 [Penicillium steckii]|uniref:Uncharacterized protein n=1 Tax=Penicillium steckii TaxID=303698 RepID=A0A1V6TTS6_9EURO|nr:hypothetical protein PENSTE_c002G00887 [Penicillium steckii]
MQTAIGTYQGSNPPNVSLVSRYYSWQEKRKLDTKEYLDIDVDDLKGQPKVSQINKYGGLEMNPTHVMFTNGELDPVRAFSVTSQDVDYGFPERKETSVVLKCHRAPGNGIYFGLIYPYEVHASDMVGEMNNKTSPSSS